MDSVGGSGTIGQAWSVRNGAIGLALDASQIGGGGGWSKSSSVEYGNGSMILIGPGHKVCTVLASRYFSFSL
jgi:hypothetical protein